VAALGNKKGRMAQSARQQAMGPLGIGPLQQLDTAHLSQLSEDREQR
jgi:hypothetical protein